jgi:GMP synthase (glutamine-hydrolysing)
MNIHILMHESFEAPGAILTWGVEHRHTITFTRFYRNDLLPRTTAGLDYLIVMGGPQSPATTESECPHFHAKEEIDFIRDCVWTDKYVLGMCLGAQLIGEALGGTFEHSPQREIGVFDVTLTEEGRKDPNFALFPPVFPAGHWHGDMPGLTRDSTILASSEGCPRQIVRYTPRVYGFQCHLEFTPESVEGMIVNGADELEANKSQPFVESATALRSHNYAEVNMYLFRFLDAMQSQVNRHTPLASAA